MATTFMRPLREAVERVRHMYRSDVVRRSARNAAYSSWEYALLPILTLVATPVFLATLGVSGFGLWTLANSLIGFGPVFGFGLTDATIRFVVKYRTAARLDAVALVIRTTFTMYVALGAVAAAVAFMSMPWLVDGVFRVPDADVDVALAALRIAALGIVVRFADSVATAALQGFERYDLSARVTMVANAGSTTTAMLLALLGADVSVVLLGALVGIGIGAGVKLVILRTVLLPGLQLRPALHCATLREVAGYGVYTWVQGLSGVLYGQLDRVIVASLLGTTALGYYAVALQLGQQVQTFLARATAFVFPLASNLYDEGRRDELTQLYVLGMRVTATAAVAIGVPLFLLAPHVLNLWVGATVATQATPALQVIAFAAALLATSITPFYFMNATAMVRLNTLFGALGSIIVAAALFVLVPGLGIVGAAWARVATLPIDVIGRTLLHARVLGDRRWYAGVLAYSPIVIAFAAAAALAPRFTEPALGILGLLAWAGALALTFGAVTWSLTVVFVRVRGVA